MRAALDKEAALLACRPFVLNFNPLPRAGTVIDQPGKYDHRQSDKDRPDQGIMIG